MEDDSDVILSQYLELFEEKATCNSVETDSDDSDQQLSQFMESFENNISTVTNTGKLLNYIECINNIIF